jgi:hypothetical protein
MDERCRAETAKKTKMAKLEEIQTVRTAKRL